MVRTNCKLIENVGLYGFKISVNMNVTNIMSGLIHFSPEFYRSKWIMRKEKSFATSKTGFSSKMSTFSRYDCVEFFYFVSVCTLVEGR